jgi:hypothetical protein
MVSESMTKAEAARLFATAWNRLDHTVLEPWLAEDLHYASQQVFDEITCKTDFMSYLSAKMRTVGQSDGGVFGELGETRTYPAYTLPPEPCVVMAQGSEDDVVAVVLFQTSAKFIQRIDMCTVAPVPESAHRTGQYPR